MKQLALLAMLLVATPALGGDPSAGTVREGSTGAMWLWFCSDAYAVTAPAECPKGGALVTYSDVSALTKSINDRATNLELLASTADSATSNPYKMELPYTANLIVGTCSNNAGTSCGADADCGSGNTCDVPKKPEPQMHVLTLAWTVGGKPYRQRIPFYVTPLEYYP